MKLAVAAIALAATGCSLITDSFVTNEFSGDPHPIYVEMDSGAIVVGLRQSGEADRTAVIDLLSPVTLVDPGLGVAPSVDSANLLLLGQHGPGGPITLPRAYLDASQVIALHPCLDPECVVGPVTAPRPYEAVIGADVLAGDAVRLRLGDELIFVLASVAGDELHRTHACDGVFPSPYRGGGTLLIAGTELPFGGRRIALQSCLGANPDPAEPQSQRGTDALMVLSTSVGISILGESAYERYREAHVLTAPALDTLPMESVNLPSGPIDGRRGTIANIALVGSSSQNPRAACRQVYASHFMAQRNCTVDDDCPCEDQDLACATPAIHELSPPAGIDVLIVSDANATLQALRTELRPDQAEVDGILGTDALRSSEIDIDYPNNRILTRCVGSNCVARPAFNELSDRTHVQGCLEYAPPGPMF